MTERQLIDDFLAQKRIAVIGVSRNSGDFTRAMFNEFIRRGYDAVPVNPNATEIDGRKSFARAGQVDPKVEAALIMTPAKLSDAIARECAEAGIQRVWFYGVSGRRAADKPAVDFCESRGMQVVAGRCPFMFFPNSGFHGLHSFLLKLIGRYPR